MTLSMEQRPRPYEAMRNGPPDVADTEAGLDQSAESLTELIETYRAGDIDMAVENLEWLLGKLKRASKARRALARASERQLRAALTLRRERTGASR
jgi:hypothetical protein